MVEGKVRGIVKIEPKKLVFKGVILNTRVNWIRAFLAEAFRDEAASGHKTTEGVPVKVGELLIQD